MTKNKIAFNSSGNICTITIHTLLLMSPLKFLSKMNRTFCINFRAVAFSYYMKRKIRLGACCREQLLKEDIKTGCNYLRKTSHFQLKLHKFLTHVIVKIPWISATLRRHLKGISKETWGEGHCQLRTMSIYYCCSNDGRKGWSLQKCPSLRQIRLKNFAEPSIGSLFRLHLVSFLSSCHIFPCKKACCN